MTPEEWILTGEVGISSKTIWAVMMGVVKEPMRCDGWHYDTPRDPDDFSRCYKLIQLFPEWKSRLNEVSRIFPKWTPYIREWDKLTNLYICWHTEISDWHVMYDFMATLHSEAMKLDGWTQIGSSSWERK